ARLGQRPPHHIASCPWLQPPLPWRLRAAVRCRLPQGPAGPSASDWRSLWGQLSKKNLARRGASYGYVGLRASAVVAINVLTFSYSHEHPDAVVVLLYLGVLSQLMTIPEVRLDRGTLTL